MNIDKSKVTFSSIVEIGELAQKLEKESGDKYLKLHRGVMDVTNIDLNSFTDKIDFNDKKIQHYGGNDGDDSLIKTIKSNFNLENHFVLTVPGGMATLDLVINSLSDKTFWIPKYHWGSWNKILMTHGKEIKTFNDFDLDNTTCFENNESEVVMLCYPSNPTGFLPKLEEISKFAKNCKDNNKTLILDMPYYYLFNEPTDEIYKLYTENVIILSSFSKSVGLSGLRVGYIATLNEELYSTLRVRSLYKYNSISTVPQTIINNLFTTNQGKQSFDNYRRKTQSHIKKNIEYLSKRNLLFSEYKSIPVGPFAIVNRTFDELLKNKITSVPLNKFTIGDCSDEIKNYSRISVSVDHDLFIKYFDKVLENTKELT
jgi:aspartate aminotransferase